MKLLVISDAPILSHISKKEAYAPYVKEMDLWLRHAGKVSFVCPTRYKRTLLTQPFQNQDFKVLPLRRLEFHNVIAALISLITIPYQTIVLWNAMRKADHIHLRCPGNLALLASMVQVTLPRKRKSVKYAGNFSPTASQPFSYRWQKRILSNTTLSKNIDLLVYGEWPNQSRNVKPFFTATYSEKDRKDFQKEFNEPLQFIFVGTLSVNKNPQSLMELVTELNHKGIRAQAHFYGDGPMMEELKVQSSEFQVEVSNVSSSESREQFQKDKTFYFYGNQPSDVVKRAYQNAHFSFLASQSEGWPKAVAESMWYGCIPISTPVSCVPWMLGVSGQNQIGSRGIIFKYVDQITRLIKELVDEKEKMATISHNAQRWSHEYTLEKFETEIIKLLQS
ncbi:glycosyl transferase family 1 [Nonlabens arenilitoris]|uniref:Glycosyl transferase family 1 n=1 Tax=Nonlabens arenilitoris TaxID=1217969 RepID=A0A2S7UC60_9FLAO|nr:glycosyltransferase [Nonlabens arenilitoris]PQJ32200.1 glycosyl transferase family 1 [Nonlabens arenilitoris]